MAMGGFRVLKCEVRRRQRGWSQRQLGQLVRIPQPKISLIEHGRYVPSPQQFPRLCRALDLPADELLKPVVIDAPQQLTLELTS
jgi:transcriptional regulator with XRE-family HTH domain